MISGMFLGNRRVGIPRCAVCGRAVALVTTHVDHATQSLVVEVKCHGDRQVSVLTVHDMAPDTTVITVDAFSQPLLENCP